MCRLGEKSCFGILEGLKLLYRRLTLGTVGFKSANGVKDVCRIRTTVFTAAQISRAFFVLP